MMTSGLHLQDQEDESQETGARAICHDAAIFVVNGYERPSAVERATKIFEAQQEAENDVTGAKGTLAEAQSPNMPKGKEAQVHAIAQELYEAYFE